LRSTSKKKGNSISGGEWGALPGKGLGRVLPGINEGKG